MPRYLSFMAALESILQETSISGAIALVRSLDYHSLSALTATSSADLSELEQEVSDSSSSTITYSLNSEFTAQATSIDYEQLWYGDRKTIPPSFTLDEDYWSITVAIDEIQSEMISNEEAQQVIIDIQYATVMGNSTEINSEERRKLNLWIMFNPAQFKMAESLYAVTSNVDYRPLV